MIFIGSFVKLLQLFKQLLEDRNTNCGSWNGHAVWLVIGHSSSFILKNNDWAQKHRFWFLKSDLCSFRSSSFSTFEGRKHTVKLLEGNSILCFPEVRDIFPQRTSLLKTQKLHMFAIVLHLPLNSRATFNMYRCQSNHQGLKHFAKPYSSNRNFIRHHRDLDYQKAFGKRYY